MKRLFTLRILWVADLAWLALAILVSTYRVFDVWMPWLASTPTGTLMPSVGLMGLGAVVGLFGTYRAAESKVLRPSYGQAIAIILPTMMITAVGLVVSREYWSREWLVTVFGLWFVLLLLHRTALRMRPWSESLVVITPEKQLADTIDETPNAVVRAVVAPDGDPEAVVLSDDVNLVVDLRSVMSEEMARFVSSASMSGQRITPLVDVYEAHTGRLPLVHLVRGWELTRPVERSNYAPFKRVVDIALVAITAPLWIAISGIVWVVVRLDSKGPAIYRQVRVGKGGKPFMLLKFRTMTPDAERDGPQFATVNDPRLTRVGKFLRRSRLDEVPQLWNVVRGDLALVGPRPERPVFVEQFTDEIPFYASRHLVRPGVTGWAQVHRGYGSGAEDAFDKLTYDLFYVKHSSFWLDLQILGRSMWTVLTGAGAR